MVQINGIVSDYLVIEKQTAENELSKRFDISGINFELLIKEFAKNKKKILL